MSKILGFLRTNILIFLLVLIAMVLSYQNYTPGTYLSGWDTLHPEFNFGEYFKRILSVWQPHQGLGAPPSQGHAAELPRMIIYWLSSLFLPEHFLRYGYFFLCLILGPVGVYFFLKEGLKSFAGDSLFKNVAAYCGGLLYLLNLATLQHYQVPLEMFATHYASLGWIFYLTIRYLREGGKKLLFSFALIIFLAAPMAHTPTLFYIFLGVFSAFLLLFALFSYRKYLLKAIGLILLIVVLNLYWILPNIYYVKNYGASVVSSKIHSQFSDRAFLVGRNFANPRDTALLKNFIFDWGKYDDQQGLFVHLLANWEEHFRSGRVNLIGLLIFFLVLIGLVISIFQKQLIGVAMMPVLLISYFFIANDNQLFQYFIEYLQSKLSVIREAIRFPYTKFSILLLLSMCFYFSIAILFLLNNSEKRIKRFLEYITSLKLSTNFLQIIVSATLLFSITTSLIWFMWPAFKGDLINPKMRVKIPNEYFQLFDYFEQKGIDERIADFPIHNFWGWSYYNFGYEGAGFLWFGLRQPLLNREFDRWMPANENYYWEVSYALYSQNLPLLESVLEKYKVSWLLLNGYAIDASSAKSPYLEQLESLISRSDKIKYDKSFGDIKLYKYNLETEYKGSITILDNLPKIGPKYLWNNYDLGFSNYSNYVSVSDKSSLDESDIYYPFRSLFANRSQQEQEFNVEETEDYYIFSAKVPENVKKYDLIKPDSEAQSLDWFDKSQLDESGYYLSTIEYINGDLRVYVPKVKGYFSAEIDSASEINNLSVKNCDYLSSKRKGRKVDDISTSIVDDSPYPLLRIKSILGNNCSGQFYLSDLPNKYSYIISIDSRNREGKSLLFWLENTNARRSDLESYLPKEYHLNKSYFIQPPMEEHGLGYYLHFDNWSFNRSESVNDLGKITVYPVPFEYLTHIYFENPEQSAKKASAINTDKIELVKHPIPTLYTVSTKENINNSTVVLSEAFDFGWSAYTIDGLKIKKVSDHILINNWANGWEIKEPTSKIYMFYLPQLLQFLGYFFFVVALLVLFNPFTLIKRVFSSKVSR